MPRTADSVEDLLSVESDPPSMLRLPSTEFDGADEIPLVGEVSACRARIVKRAVFCVDSYGATTVLVRRPQDITEDGRAVPRLVLLEAQVALFAQLCFDRNYIAIKHLRRDWPKDLILHCMGTPELTR